MPQRGDEAPDFTLPDADGRQVSLSGLRGRPVILYFYPRNDTAGCTAQACGIRDAWDEFEALGAAVVGVSPDSVASHAGFRRKHDLPHTLLADPDREAISRYGAWGTKKVYGEDREGVLRSTFLIDLDGRVAAVWPAVRPKEHADQVLAALRDLLRDLG